MEMTPALHFRDIKHRFSGHTVVSDLNLCLRQGDVMALVGRSGIGKTTLLHLALGLQTPTAGTVENLFDTTSCVFQDPRLLPWFTARTNIELGLKARKMPPEQRRSLAEDIGKRMGLTSADLDKYPASLSGGMARRVSLARALVVSPEILLLDEPFSALDVGTKQSLHELLLDEIHQRALTVLLVTHDLLEAVYLAKSIVVLRPAPLGLSDPVRLTTPWQERTPAWRFQTSAELLKRETFRQAFACSPDTDSEMKMENDHA